MGETAHKPVLIDPIIRLCSPIEGIWLDGTFGAGGYTRALLQAGANAVIAIDRDPLAHEMAAAWIEDQPITLHKGEFSKMHEFAEAASLAGVVLDIGVSSMQIDEAARGFSFQKDGPLDMRMSQEGPTAADLVNAMDEAELADILYHYGEERQSRRIARAIVQDRKVKRFETTKDLASLIERLSPRRKPQDIHPATRSFQALRIAVNAELEELRQGLHSAIELLQTGGYLVVVSFHSLEDRIVKQFFSQIAGKPIHVNRYQQKPSEEPEEKFRLITRKPVTADEEERAENPRARSAKLRIVQKLRDAA